LEKAGFRIEEIANEIVHHLKNKVSERHIRGSLDKYKNRRQSTNAKKQKEKVVAQVPPTKSLVEQPSSEVVKISNKESEVDKKIKVKDQEKPINLLGHETAISEESTKIENPITTMQDQKNLTDFGYRPPIEQKPLLPSQLQGQPIRVLIDYDELNERLAELHHKDIIFWLSGTIINGRLIDLVLERDQQMVTV
jgi:hypothetical protein